VRRQSTPRPVWSGGMRACSGRKPKGVCGSPNRGFSTPRSRGGEWWHVVLQIGVRSIGLSQRRVPCAFKRAIGSIRRTGSLISGVCTRQLPSRPLRFFIRNGKASPLIAFLFRMDRRFPRTQWLTAAGYLLGLEVARIFLSRVQHQRRRT
jgi:hypothetical protein